jgi:hypothetical protein
MRDKIPRKQTELLLLDELEEKNLGPSATGATASCNDKTAKQQADCNAKNWLK